MIHLETSRFNGRSVVITEEFSEGLLVLQPEVAGVLGLARSLVAPGGALRVTIGMPGDRSDADLGEVARGIAAGRPAEVVVRELGPGLLRGRAPGAIPAVLAAAFAAAGIAVRHAADELAALELLLAASQPGDLVLVLVHLDPAVDARLSP